MTVHKLLLTSLILVLAGCVTEQEEDAPRGASAGGVDLGLERQVRVRVAGLQRLQGAPLLHSLQVLISCGSSARAVVIESLASPDPHVRAGLLYVLGFIGGEEARVAVAKSLADAEAGVRYEAAAALLQLGSLDGMPVLIALLDHSEARMRMKAMDAVSARAGTDFGYRFDAQAGERGAAVERVRQWWRATTAGAPVAGRQP